MTKFPIFILFWIILSCIILYFLTSDDAISIVTLQERKINLGPVMYFDPPDTSQKSSKDQIAYENIFMLLDVKNLICTPFSFGYSWEEAESLFPSYNFPKCSSLIKEPKWDISEWVFSMACKNYSDAALVQGPTGNVKFPSSKVHKRLWQSEHFSKKLKLNQNTDFLLATCDYKENFDVAWHRPNYNYYLHERAKNLMKENPVKKPLFILTLGLDSFSRRHFFQKLPKTIEVLNKLVKEFKIFDFKLHNIAGKATVNNITPLFIDDKDAKKLKKSTESDKMGDKAMWVDFKKRGFITSMLTDDCDYRVYNNIGPEPDIDYVSRQFFCAASKYTDYVTGKKKKMKQRCIGSQMSHAYIFQYLHDLLNMYPDVNQWIYVHLNAAHESTGRHAQTLDPDLSEFLTSFLPKVAKTHEVMINLLGDHGMRYGNWKYSVDGDQEMKLPVFIMILSDFYINSVPKSNETLLKNTLRLVTKQDIRQTLLGILNRISLTRDSKNKYAYDLFSAEIPTSRNCDTFADIPNQLCSCQSYREIKPEFWQRKYLKDFVDDLIQIACDKMNGVSHTPEAVSSNLCKKIIPNDIVGVFHDPQWAYLDFKIEFTAKYSPARFLVEYHVHEDDKNHHGIPIIYDHQRLLVQIMNIDRLDEYGGACEDKSNELGLNPEYCICEYLIT